MKRMLMLLAGVLLTAGSAVAQGTNWAKAVMYDPATGLFTDPTIMVTNVVQAGGWVNQASVTNWGWSSDGVQVTLTNYTGPNDVVIPDMLDGLPVTMLRDELFLGYAITSVTGGGNLTAIEEQGFYNCSSLSSVSLLSVQLVGAEAFGDCHTLVSVNLPNATAIGMLAFYRCTNLTSITLPSAVTIAEGAIYELYSLTNAYLPTVTTLGASAFWGCTNLTSITLPSAVTIGVNSFRNCTRLTSVDWGHNAPSTQSGVFSLIPANQVTNYVTNPTATGWGSTFGNMPVVRMPITADSGMVKITGTNSTAIVNYQTMTNYVAGFTSLTFGTAPVATNSTGTAGDMVYDAAQPNYLYIGVGTDTWRRVQLLDW